MMFINTLLVIVLLVLFLALFFSLSALIIQYVRHRSVKKWGLITISILVAIIFAGAILSSLETSYTTDTPKQISSVSDLSSDPPEDKPTTASSSTIVLTDQTEPDPAVDSSKKIDNLNVQPSESTLTPTIVPIKEHPNTYVANDKTRPTSIPTDSSSTMTANQTTTISPVQTQKQITPKISAIPSNIPEYDRDEWKHWTDFDRDCQNTRHEVLIAESLSTVRFKTSRGCQVASGLWVDPYTGQTIYESTKLDVDHMVPLKNAHISGGWAWDKNRKEQFANYMSDPAHLIAVTASANRKKGAKGPEDWKPTNSSYWCTYATDWIRIKTSWDLTFTTDEWRSLESMKRDCDGNNSNAAPVNVAPPVVNTITPPTPTKQPSPPSSTSHLSVKIISISCSSKPEVVEIKNTGSQILNLTGWSLVDEGDKNKMLFRTGFTLPGGLTLTVVAGTSGEESGNTLYWSGRNVLNNDGDTAFLFNSSNELVSKMSC